MRFALGQKLVVADQSNKSNQGIYRPLGSAREIPFRQFPFGTYGRQVAIRIGLESGLYDLGHYVAAYRPQGKSFCL
jgi:hypothetical protein